MKQEIDQANIEQKQKLLRQHRRNFTFLEQQAAQHGLDVPLAMHNALTAEQDAIATLERELVGLGVAPQPKPHWQALVIDPDSHWRRIIINHVNRLGGAVIEHHLIPWQESLELIEASAVAIVGVPHHTPEEGSSRQWIEDVVKLGRYVPLILLACGENRDTVIALRRTICERQQDITAITIFKENFDPGWFSRVVHRILTR